jgi:acetyl esterase/lipase
LRARDENLPLPAAALLLTPELDLTESGDTFYTNETIDVALPHGLPRANSLYANGHDLSHPYLSPLFGDFRPGFPPTFLQSGTRDLFLSNTVRMHRALLNAGQKAELHVWEAMPHAGFGGGTPEDVEMFQAARDFLVREAGWVL